MSNREIALLRLAAQRIIGPGFGSAGEVVRHLTAMQGQDLPGAMISTALRTSTVDRGLVVEAMNAGEIVRSWPMRGTLHLVPAEDLGWMLALTAPRVMKSAARRRVELDIDDRRLARAGELAVEALSGGRALRRAELIELWEKDGLLGEVGRSYHLLAHLAWDGLLCFGPYQGGAQSLVLLDEWVASPRQLTREESLGEWVLRYFRSHGPATIKDFAWWTKLTQPDIKAGLAIARPHLDSMTADGAEYLMDPQTPDLLAEHRTDAQRMLLLPGFDEFILGYGDRSAALPAEHAGQVVPGNNGMFRGTVVADGRIVGTWKKGGTPKNGQIDAMPFATFTKSKEKALSELFLALP
ncbi:winged helix DNA-binding domain-containing protein [Tomitella biformata]|uniref:winged helix DNA-binding domain-containing protein n=1 Tax=Tomitella biformata TaxID=630403 RepID=UPI000464B994|nr:winged helix DNA-binding domain-containing protein [Tomitella biformata]